jgi:hypothetical protein
MIIYNWRYLPEPGFTSGEEKDIQIAVNRSDWPAFINLLQKMKNGEEHNVQLPLTMRGKLYITSKPFHYSRIKHPWSFQTRVFYFRHKAPFRLFYQNDMRHRIRFPCDDVNELFQL